MALSVNTINITQGTTGTVGITTVTTSGSAQAITLSLASAPPPLTQNSWFTASSGISPQPNQPAWIGVMPVGVTWGFSPAQITSGDSSTLTLTIDPEAPLGTFNLVVIATGVGAVIRQDTFVLNIVVGNATNDFSL